MLLKFFLSWRNIGSGESPFLLDKPKINTYSQRVQLSSYSNSSFSVRQDKKDIKIEADLEQKKILEEICKLQDEEFDNPEYNIHALYHSMPQYEKGMCGYTYGELVGEWAKDKPQVTKFGFDDSMFMSSVGFIIPSMSKYHHMGVNVLLCPQSGSPFDFFCYPNHLDSLLKAFGASREILHSVPPRDNSSPNFLKTQELKSQLLATVCQNQ